MANKIKDRIALKFNISQLDRLIVALLNNGENKKFAGNVELLFNAFAPESYQNDIEKEARVYLIKKIAEIICKSELKDKDSILAWLQTDGKFEQDSIGILNNLFESSLTEPELQVLDGIVSDQLRYNYLDKNADELIDLLTNLKAENYDSLAEIVGTLTENIDSLQKKLRESKESLENAKLKVSLSGNNFVKELSGIIDQERNPSAKVKTGIRAMNELLNGGFEPGQLIY